jgi:hypothetical protein
MTWKTLRNVQTRTIQKTEKLKAEYLYAETTALLLDAIEELDEHGYTLHHVWDRYYPPDYYSYGLVAFKWIEEECCQ